MNECMRVCGIKGGSAKNKEMKTANTKIITLPPKKCASFTKFAYLKCNSKMPITGNPFPNHKSWKTISSSMSVCRFAVAYIYKSK